MQSRISCEIWCHFLTASDAFLNAPGRASAHIYSAADRISAGRSILKDLRDLPGAAFGATLYCDLGHFGATMCDLENDSILFIL
jgi:hypothetical protein